MFTEPGAHKGVEPPPYLLEGNMPGHKEPRGFLECIDDNFLSQVIEE